MDIVELGIFPGAYELRLRGDLLARLAGGADALLSGAPQALREADLERMIERSEDWLMPSSKAMHGLALRVGEASGRLRVRLAGASRVAPDAVEHAFSDVLRDVSLGRPIDRSLVADLVVLREMVHHGALTHVDL